jgi:lipoprotein NlpI
MFKKSLDVISLASVAVFLGVAVWVAIWGESPRVPGHLSIESKIIVSEVVPVSFGVIWLIFRYARVATERFPLIFGRPGHPGFRNRGLLFYFVAIFGGAAVLLTWIARISSDSNDCEVMSDPSSIISACSRVIDDSGATMHKRAIAFANRASAYVKKGDNDRAIADADEAIRLDPKVAGAYVNRAGAYLQKNDNDRAIADASEAIRLNPIAVSYNNRAAAYVKKGDNDRAIADASEAIRLDPKYAIAYRNRADAYLLRDDNDRAIVDYSEAIRLDPKIAGAYVKRASAYLQKGGYDRAIADYSEAIRLDPKISQTYFNRGLLHLYAGSINKALADLKQAEALAPNDAYAALWLDIVGQRNNLPSRLPQTSSQLDMTVWPAPIVKLFMGQLTSADLMAAADDPNASTKKSHICEANFYFGELSLIRGAKDETTRLFRLAASDCPRDFTEWHAANAELKALGTAP